MGEEILSRDELDALMDGVKSGEISTEDGAMAPGEVRTHDFARRDRSLQGRLPGLDQILERAARSRIWSRPGKRPCSERSRRAKSCVRTSPGAIAPASVAISPDFTPSISASSSSRERISSPMAFTA